jgi:hypothetical protein
MENLNLICIVGNIGSGKSLTADILKSNYGYEELTFAGPVKEIGLILGFDYLDLYGTQEDKLKINNFWGVSGRTFMQIFATNIMRNEFPKELNKYKSIQTETETKIKDINDKTIWVRLCEKKIKEMLKKNKKILISDGRFPDEIEMIRELGGKIIKIERKTNYEINHDSEKYVSSINADVYIDNNGTINDLINNIKQIVK